MGNFYRMCVDHLKKNGNFLSIQSQKRLLKMIAVQRDAMRSVRTEDNAPIIDAALDYDGESFVPKILRGDDWQYERSKPKIEVVRKQTWNRSWNQKGGKSANEDSDSRE